MYVYVCVIISALQLKKPRNRIKLFNQGTYESKWLNSKLRSHDPIFNHLITPHVVSQCLDLEDCQSYNRPVDFDSVEIKAQENYFLKTPKLILIMSRSGDPCTIHWGRKENARRDFPPRWSHSKRQKGSQPTWKGLGTSPQSELQSLN